MVLTTVLLAFKPKFATDSLEGLMQTAGLSKTFVGVILLPLLGNDAHPGWTAVKDRMDICVNVKLGRCLQNAILIVPAIVLLGWMMGIDEMSKNFADVLSLQYFSHR